MDEVITELSGPEHPAASGNTRQLVILLHGLGSDGADLISLAPEFSAVLPDAHFISPNAPFACDIAPFGYQWFSLMNYNPEFFNMPSFDPRDMVRGAENAAPILNHFIDKQLKKFDLKDKDLALVGFSQGTMMSLYVALRRPSACAGVLGYSGAMLDANPQDAMVKARPPVCLVHGALDHVVPYMAMETARRGLDSVDVPVEVHTRPMLGHGIDGEGIAVGKAFLEKVLG